MMNMAKKMGILFWVPYPRQGASNRYRVEQFLPFLKERYKVRLRPFWSEPAYKILYEKGRHLRKIFYFALGFLSRISDLICISRFDIVFIHREACPIGGAFFETLAARAGRPIVFDFDDAIYLASSSRCNNFIEKLKRPGKVESIIKKSSVVIAGNNYLADFSRRFNHNTWVIPTCIDTGKYRLYEKEVKEEVVIGWVGSITTLDFLRPMENTFRRLSAKFANLKFKVVGGHFSLDGLSNITSVVWSEPGEKSELLSLDIGIMPMPDNEWTKGKCGFKAILYMSMGLPCVCADVGANKDIIEDGLNGYLASSEEEWVSKLSLLVESAELRRKIGAAGRKTAEERFSLKANTPKFLAVIQSVAASVR
ncbi:glycosyltransferase [bacterium]|nr:MAG: glycosyltransferase [bacterium]